jgi:hypothetical protein
VTNDLMDTAEINKRIDRICKSLGTRSGASLLNTLHACRPDHPWNKTAITPFQNALFALDGRIHDIAAEDMEWLRRQANAERLVGEGSTTTATPPAQFAPGPYKVRVDVRSVNAQIVAPGGENVATVWSGKKPSIAKVEANAALLAASPLMHAAIDQVLQNEEAVSALRKIKVSPRKSLWDVLDQAAEAAVGQAPRARGEN